MIYHFKDKLQDLSYALKTPLKYSEDFTFIPIRIKNKEFIVQTAKVFVPFGAFLNSFHTKTPQAAATIVAPCPKPYDIA